MGVFSRLGDIINSNIIHMLDKAEDPEKMVRLMIQEMEDTLVEVKSQAAKFIADKKSIERQQTHIQREILKWQSNAELALSKNREDLAKEALMEKGPLEEKLVSTQADLETIDVSLDKLKQDIKSLEAKLLDAKKRHHSIIIKKKAAQNQLKMRKQMEKYDSHHSTAKFDEYERSIDRLEGRVESMSSSLDQSLENSKLKNLEDDFKILEKESKINNELELLKKKMGIESVGADQ